MKKLFVFILMVLSVIVLNGCKKEEKLVVYTEAGFAPFEYLDGDDIIGVDVDIMNLVGEKLGKKIEFKNVNFNRIIDIVKEGKLGKIGAAGLSINEERLEKVNFSSVYYTANLYVIYNVNKGIETNVMSDGVTGVYWSSVAKGLKVGVQTGTTADIFAADYLEEDKLTGYEALGVAVEAIGSKIDVVIIDELPAKMLIEGKSDLACLPLYDRNEDDNVDELSCDQYAIAVNKNEEEILNVINEVLAELGEEGIQELVNKHLGLTK